MAFYFFVYTFMGMVAVSANILRIEGIKDIASTPRWVFSNFNVYLILFGFFSCVIALLTSLINQGIMWSAIALAEVAFGAILAWMIPKTLRIIIAITSPVTVAIILGNLWGFWYI